MDLTDITSEPVPFVSVVMPVRNEAQFIERSLGAVLRQTYPRDSIEVVIADGLSSDETRSRIEKLQAETGSSIRIVNNPEKIAPTGLNRAIAACKGEIVIRVDGHCEIDSDYVENCVKHLQSGKADGVGGPLETIGETLKAKAIAVAMSSAFGVGGSAFRCVTDREMYVDTVAFPGYTRSLLELAGPFNEELVRNQDDEFNYRVRKLGGRILLAPDIRSRYFSRSGFRALCRQYFQYGYWKVRVLQLHPRQMSARQFAPLVFVSSIIFLSAFSIFFTPARWLLAADVVLYLLASLAAALKEIPRLNILALPFLLLSFPVIHVSYGFGFLAGLFAFYKKWFTKKTVSQ